MLTNKRGLISNYIAEGAATKLRLVTFGTADTQAVQASAVTSKPLGVTTEVDAVDTGEMDVVLSGISPVEYGGTVAHGDALTSDANGKAIKSTATTDQIFGRALLSGVVDDIGSIHLRTA